MWFWRRRRRLPPPLHLPLLDRLAELIERVVALLDQVELAPAVAQREEVGLKEHNPAPAADGWVAFVQSPDGYRLLQRDGPPPDRGAAVELDEGVVRVLSLGPSPLPADRRRCAFVATQEPPLAERTFDR